jgi:hypothetical protein
MEMPIRSPTLTVIEGHANEQLEPTERFVENLMCSLSIRYEQESCKARLAACEICKTNY